MSLESFQEFSCPYCGSINGVEIDYSAGRRQEFITDCETCCNAIVVRVELRGTELISFEAIKENG